MRPLSKRENKPYSYFKKPQFDAAKDAAFRDIADSEQKMKFKVRNRETVNDSETGDEWFGNHQIPPLEETEVKDFNFYGTPYTPKKPYKPVKHVPLRPNRKVKGEFQSAQIFQVDDADPNTYFKADDIPLDHNIGDLPDLTQQQKQEIDFIMNTEDLESKKESEFTQPDIKSSKPMRKMDDVQYSTSYRQGHNTFKTQQMGGGGGYPNEPKRFKLSQEDDTYLKKMIAEYAAAAGDEDPPDYPKRSQTQYIEYKTEKKDQGTDQPYWPRKPYNPKKPKGPKKTFKKPQIGGAHYYWGPKSDYDIYSRKGYKNQW